MATSNVNCNNYDKLNVLYIEYGALKQWSTHKSSNKCNDIWKGLFDNYKKRNGFKQNKFDEICKDLKSKITLLQKKSLNIESFFGKKLNKPIRRNSKKVNKPIRSILSNNNIILAP
eukprot:47402_1